MALEPTRWTHTLTRDTASAAYDQAAARALAGHPLSVADLQIIAANTLFSIEASRGNTPLVSGESANNATLLLGAPRTDETPHTPVADAAAEQTQTFYLLLKIAGLDPKGVPPLVMTTFDEPPKPQEIAGFAALGAWVQIAIVAAAAGVVLYAVHQASAIVDRALSRSADARKLAEINVRRADILEAQRAKEAAAGKALPLNDADKQALADLTAVQTQIAARVEQPLPGTVAPVTQTGLFGWGLALAGALGLYVVLSD